MAIINSNIHGLSTIADTSYFTVSPLPSYSDSREYLSTLGNNLLDSSHSPSETYIFYENDIMRLEVELGNNYDNYRKFYTMNLYDKVNQSYVNGAFTSDPNFGKTMYCAIGYDDEEQKAYYWWSGKFYYNREWTQTNRGLLGNSASDQRRAYELISGSQLLWSPVTSITGNEKIYILTQIASLNDGMAVSNANRSAFSVLNDESKVDVFVNSVVQDMTKVTVNYTIPSSTYSYIKLVYKQGSIPVDKDDGTAIDILQASTSQVISGIADGNTYWFVIFTDKTTSDAKSLTTIT